MKSKSTKSKPVAKAIIEVGDVVKIGDAAKRCGVGKRQVHYWIANGHLEGWRSPGSSRNVGVWGPSLDAFLAHGLQLSRAAREAEKSAQHAKAS